MNKPNFLKLFLISIALFSLAACGGGGGGGGGTTDPQTRTITGGGVKGPLANAIVTVYAFDASQPGFQGAVAANGSTDASAATTGLALPFPVAPPYIMEFTSDASTTDITTGLAPVIGTMRTIITQSLLDTGEQIYATPLTTMAVDIAIANSTTTTTAAEFEAALIVAATQVVSTLGFGMDASIDIFDTPPLVDSTTGSTAEQADVAAYRTAVEAITAIAYQIDQQTVGGNTDSVLSELAADLADGGGIDGSAGSEINTNTLQVLAQDPASLVIPNTNQTVADVQAILVSETATTGTTTSTTQLGTGGSITTVSEPAETNPDTDGDGVLNVDDAFPENASETVDTDGDGIGDNADLDDDNNGILDVDEGLTPTPAANDTDLDGIDDSTDNCAADYNPSQTDSDGDNLGDACDIDNDDDLTPDASDAFPLDGSEQSDADSDGVGDNADLDDDNDGLTDINEDLAIADPDADGIPNREDTDSDNDGVLDSVDFAPYDNLVTFNFAPVTIDDSVSVIEDAVIFSIDVTANDTDDDGNPGDTITLSAIGANNASLGSTAIVGNNISYTVAADVSGTDTFTYTVTDGTVSSTGSVIVTITAVNDAPVVNAVGPFVIAENAVNGVAVGTVTASDVDSTISGYSIVTGNTGNAFAINASGAITVANTAAIDFETAVSFVLGITATDGTEISAPQNVTINITDVNDNAPIVGVGQSFSVAEDAVNATVVGSVSASDADSVITGYSISAGNTGAAFAIDTSGVITVADTLAIDFETSTSFILSITATDGANTSAAENVTVNVTDVNDTAPVVGVGQSFSVAEDTVDTTVVGSVIASDVDSVVTGFSITAGNTGTAFAIDANGVITVADTAAIDFEASSSFTLSITATDGTNTSAAENVTINVTDANDNTPVVAVGQSFSVAENVVNTTVVGTVAASDADTSPVTGFGIAGGNTGVAFAIDAAGVITVNDATAIDFEASTSFILSITATDGTNTSAAENVTINITDVNDSAPIVGVGQSFSVAEDAVNTTVVGSVIASDVDSVVTGYSITAGNTGTAFAIDANGVIIVADTLAIDFETSTSFNLSITATDGTNTSAAENVTINITDVNDTSPIVDAVGPFSLAENSANSTLVGTVTATDADTVGSVTGYNITGGNTGTAFAIDASGAITVLSTLALDRETTPSFTLTVTATDGTNISASQNIAINLTDLNDTAPVITSGQTFGVNSAAANGAVVGTVIAADADTTGSVTGFSITSGNTGTAFSIAASGQITVADNTNLLTNSPYTLTITATDGINTSLSTTVGITVTTGGAVWDNFNWDDGSTWQ